MNGVFKGVAVSVLPGELLMLWSRFSFLPHSGAVASFLLTSLCQCFDSLP